MIIKYKQLLLFIFTLDTMIIPVLCGNKRIKIHIPEHIKHVHHHHVKKVPVYIVTKEKPRVMHASHIEEEYEDGYRKSPKLKSHPEYDEAVIQGIYIGDESHIHEDEYRKSPKLKSHLEYDDAAIQGIYKEDASHIHGGVDSKNYDYSTALPQIEKIKPKLPYLLQNNRKKKHSSYNTVTRQNRLRLYDY